MDSRSLPQNKALCEVMRAASEGYHLEEVTLNTTAPRTAIKNGR